MQCLSTNDAIRISLAQCHSEIQRLETTNKALQDCRNRLFKALQGLLHEFDRIDAATKARETDK